MGFRSKISETYEAIKSHGKKSLAKLSQLTHHSKSSTHRQIKKINSRSAMVGADFFETTNGARWLRRLVLAATLVFGLQGNIGADRLALFFDIICITAFIGVSASSMGRLKHKMMEMLQVYQQELQPTLNKLAAHIKIVAGADETFFDRLLILLFMDLGSGYICLEESAENRKATTWDEKTALARSKFKEVLCLVSDRGKSLIKFAKNTKIKSVAELYHMQASVVKLFRYAFAAKRRSLKKQQKATEKELSKLILSNSKVELIKSQERKLAEIEAQNTRINNGQTIYRQQLREISIVTHPFSQDSQLKTSAKLRSQLSSSLTILRKVAQNCGIKDNKKRLNYFENSIADMGALVDLWWQWVDCDLENQQCCDELKDWIKTTLLPTVYWQQQIKKSRSSKSQKDYYIDLYTKAEKVLHADPLTEKYRSPHWDAWSKQLVSKFQRSTSQVEGHNARLSESHHCLRGMSALQIKADNILHNCWIKRDDGTTATERLFNFKPPDLFEWLVDNMPELALPRKRKKNQKDSILPQSAAIAI